MTGVRLGRVAGLEVSFVPSALVGSAAMWGGFAAIGFFVFRASLAVALGGGLVMALLHWVDELLHNIGHATAARAVGRPMTGVQFWSVFGLSQYPPDEEELTPAMHIRRALGGPALSAVVTVIAGLIAVLMFTVASPVAWVALLVFLDNLLVFTLGAFLPLGFTDGSTLLYWARRRA
jgi:hypothetical protein